MFAFGWQLINLFAAKPLNVVVETSLGLEQVRSYIIRQKVWDSVVDVTQYISVASLGAI